MAAASGVVRTRVGYCGGKTPDPTYRKVCSDSEFADWAEAVQVDFDDSIISYESLVEKFFDSHDHWLGSGKRQYMSCIFYHTEDQKSVALTALARRAMKRRVATLVEPATDFYEAEAYHQKWLLQRRSGWLDALALPDTRALVDSPAAAALNACAGGAVPPAEVRGAVAAWVDSRILSPDAGAALQRILDRA